MRRLAIGIVLGSLLASACGDAPCDRPVCPEDMIDAGPGADVEQAFTLRPNDFVEAWVSMAAGTSLVVEFEAFGGSLEWDLHSHSGDDVTQHDVGVDSSREVQFVSPFAGDFFFLFENTAGSDVAVSARIQVAGGDQFVRWL